MSDDEYVMVELIDGNVGQHPIIGGFTRNRYGYRQHGDKFLIHRSDLTAHPGKFKEVLKATTIPAGVVEEKPPTPEPQPVEGATVKVSYNTESTADAVQEPDETERPFDLQTVPGITTTIAQRMEEAGIVTLEQIAALSFDELMAVKGIAEARAEQIQAYVREQIG